MKQDYVLRPISESAGEIRFALRAHNQIQRGDATPEAFKVLRREPNGFVTALLGGRVIHGFIARHNGELTLTITGRSETFSLQPAALDAMRQNLLQAKCTGGPVEVKSPIPGLIKAVLIEANATVAAGQPLAILEAMKMENEIRAPHTGVVEKICVSSGQNVPAGAALFSIR